MSVFDRTPPPDAEEEKRRPNGRSGASRCGVGIEETSVTLDAAALRAAAALREHYWPEDTVLG